MRAAGEGEGREERKGPRGDGENDVTMVKVRIWKGYICNGGKPRRAIYVEWVRMW